MVRPDGKPKNALIEVEDPDVGLHTRTHHDTQEGTGARHHHQTNLMQLVHGTHLVFQFEQHLSLSFAQHNQIGVGCYGQTTEYRMTPYTGLERPSPEINKSRTVHRLNLMK